MARMKIDMPKEWHFSITMKVRVTDLNYGNHLANQQFLAFAQEARMAYFAQYGFTELDFGGTSLIQADAAITYKGEGHLNDEVQIEVAAQTEGGSSFNIFYKFIVGLPFHVVTYYLQGTRLVIRVNIYITPLLTVIHLTFIISSFISHFIIYILQN